jgi:hypothetical protein
MAKDLVAVEKRVLTPAQYGDLADVPPELECLANITNPKTRRAYSRGSCYESGRRSGAQLGWLNNNTV